jgi:PEP-CTERM/exosortase A-associated glycosyltransferase
VRILHILDHSPPLQSGYVFRTMAILREQRALGWQTLQLTTPKHFPRSDLVEIVDGWEFHRTPAPCNLLSKAPLANQLAVIGATTRRLKELVRDWRPDILHPHSPVLNAMSALRVGKAFGLPVVYEIRAFWEDAAADHGTARASGPRYRATQFLETMALRRVQAITTISKGLRQSIIQRGIAPEKVTIIPNGVDPENFSPTSELDPHLAARLGTTGKTVLGFIGSFYAYEGLDLLLRTLSKILISNNEIRFLLIGGGPEESGLRALTQTLGLTGHVAFVGRVQRDRVPDHYDLIDILVYPRKSTRLTELVTPLKPLEAMAKARVVLASDVGGHGELIEDGKTGFLFKADDPDDLSRRLLELFADRSQWPRVGASAREFVQKERRWASAVARYKGVYERASATM